MSDIEDVDAPPTLTAGSQPDPFAELRRALVEEHPEQPRLSWRSAMVLRLRFGLHNEAPKTLEEIGVVFGITRERVRQVETKALAALGLEHLRSPASPDPAGGGEPEPGYRRLCRVADVPDHGQGDDLRVWFRGAWRSARLRKRYQRVCDLLVDLGDGERAQTRLPVTCIAIPGEAEPAYAPP